MFKCYWKITVQIFRFLRIVFSLYDEYYFVFFVNYSDCDIANQESKIDGYLNCGISIIFQ